MPLLARVAAASRADGRSSPGMKRRTARRVKARRRTWLASQGLRDARRSSERLRDIARRGWRLGLGAGYDGSSRGRAERSACTYYISRLGRRRDPEPRPGKRGQVFVRPPRPQPDRDTGPPFAASTGVEAARGSGEWLGWTSGPRATMLWESTADWTATSERSISKEAGMRYIERVVWKPLDWYSESPEQHTEGARAKPHGLVVDLGDGRMLMAGAPVKGSSVTI